MYPVCLHIADQLCVVLGGGSVAERKVRGLLKAGARVRVVSPKCSTMLQNLAGQNQLEWRQKNYDSTDLTGARLVFAATNNAETQRAILRDSRRQGILVNSADDPAACDFHLPASIQRGDLLLCVSTNGRSPALAAKIRQNLEITFGPEYALLTELIGQVRDCALQEGWHKERKEQIFAALLHADILCWLQNRQVAQLRGHMRELLGSSTVAVDLDFLGPEAL